MNPKSDSSSADIEAEAEVNNEDDPDISKMTSKELHELLQKLK